MRLRGGDDDREAEAPIILISNVQFVVGAPLPWSGRGNVFTAIGGKVLDLAGHDVVRLGGARTDP